MGVVIEAGEAVGDGPHLQLGVQSFSLLLRPLALRDVESCSQDRWLPLELNDAQGKISPAHVAALGHQLGFVASGNIFPSLAGQPSLFDQLLVVGMDEIPEIHRQ